MFGMIAFQVFVKIRLAAFVSRGYDNIDLGYLLNVKVVEKWT